MGTLTFFQAATMPDTGISYGTVTSASATNITIADSSGNSGAYYGSFFYSSTGYLTGGTITGYDSYIHSALAYQARNFSLNALTSYLYSGNALGFYQYALSGNDTINGSAFSDTLLGYGGNDTFIGGAGNDTIDGGTGVNTAGYSGRLTNYTITNTSTGYSVKDNIGADGTDALTNIQSLQFANGTIQLAANLTVSTPDGSATRSLAQFTDATGQRLEQFYLGYYGRAADYNGLVYWKQTLANVLGGDQTQMVAAFGNAQQAEFVNLYGTRSDNTTFLNAVFQNLFSHQPDNAGREYWLAVINNAVNNGTPLAAIRATTVAYIIDGAGAADAAILNAKIAGMTTISQQIATYDQSNTFGNSTSLAITRSWTQGQVTGSTPPYTVLETVTEKAIANAAVGGNEVQTSTSYTLPSGFMNLKLTGSAALTGAGNAADNLIYGNGAGSSLTGAGGNDVFIVTGLPNTPDRVTDFNSSRNAIVVDTAGFRGLTSGFQTVQAYGYETGTVATLVYDQSSGTLYYDADGAGSQSPQAILLLTGVPILSTVSIWSI